MEPPEVRRRLTPAPWWAAAVLVVAVLMLLTLAALGAQGLPGSETRPPPFVLNIDLLVVGRVVLGIFAGLIILFLVLALLPGGPPIRLPRRRRWSPLRLLAALVLLFAMLMILQPLADLTGPESQPAGTADAASEGEGVRPQPSGSRWGLIILGGAVLLVIWGVAVATRQSTELEEPAAEAPAPVVVTGVLDEVLAELEGTKDPREVVIGAYVRMERAFAAAGLPRRSSDAPLEYLTRSLRRLQVGRPAVTRLTSLFEVARFSDHEIYPEMGREAEAAFNEIRDELSGAWR